MVSKKYCYKYPRPMLTVDTVVLNFKETVLVLLVKRKYNPYAGCWALPGGFVEMNEDLKDAALRELTEETSIDDIDLFQVMTVGTPGRDPRGRCVTVVYSGGYSGKKDPHAGDDAESVKWFALKKLPDLAFDHEKIILTTIAKWIASSKKQDQIDRLTDALKDIKLPDVCDVDFL